MSLEQKSTAFKLILVQLIYEKGEVFDEIAEDLNKHPMLKNEDVKTNPKECENFYNQLLEEEGLEKVEDKQISVKSKKSHSHPIWVQTLAQNIYKKYTEEVSQMIQNDEIEFKQVFEEIETLKKGEIK